MIKKELINKNGRGSTEPIMYIPDSEEFYKAIIPEEYDEELCIEAVMQEPHALKFINPQTLEICKEAIIREMTTMDYVEQKYFGKLCKELDILYLPKGENTRRLIIRKINDGYKCWIGCKNEITLDQLIHDIYFEDGGLFKNPHRQVYLDFLKDNGLIKSQLLDSTVPLPDFDEEVDWI